MKILIAEDDRALSVLLQKSLEKQDDEVSCAADGASVIEQIFTLEPDLLLLDLGLPRMDGIEVLRTAREALNHMSVIVLTGRSQVASKVECLNLGADDYLVKPFSLYELMARCRAVRRRRSQHSPAGLLQHGDLQMNRLTRAVTCAGSMVEFTAKEFTLLEYLLLQRGRAVSRQELLREVWRMPPDAGTNVVDVYINYLRRKLGQDQNGGIIETVRGEGYAIGIRSDRLKPPQAVRHTPVFDQAGAA